MQLLCFLFYRLAARCFSVFPVYRSWHLTFWQRYHCCSVTSCTSVVRSYSHLHLLPLATPNCTTSNSRGPWRKITVCRNEDYGPRRWFNENRSKDHQGVHECMSGVGLTNSCNRHVAEAEVEVCLSIEVQTGCKLKSFWISSSQYATRGMIMRRELACQRVLSALHNCVRF